MRTTVTLGLFLLLAPVLYGQEDASQTIDAPLFTEAPKIDGRLDEAVWQKAAVIDSFVQIAPNPGDPPTEKTEVRIGYDEDKIYIGARCYTEDPSTINSVILERDFHLQNEDSLQIIFDTFNDKDSGFYFAVNPVGVQVDALVRDNGDDVNYNWDGVWFSATSRDAEGWVAEIAIPVRNLRFAEVPEHTWGFNVLRSTVAKREYVLWQQTGSARPINAVFKVSQAGTLTGLEGIRPGRSWDLMPYVVVRADRSTSVGDGEDIEVGIDVKKSLTSKLTLDLTYNLDFAETEIDAQEINLTRFPLLLPEKRDFFLESANNFYFGERSGAVRAAQNMFFFSRRIGLTEDGRRQIPVLGGAKLSGQLGGVDVGMLNLTTEDFTYRDRDGVERFEPETNFTVARFKKNIFKRSSLGAIYLNKAVKDGADSSGSGLDWNFGLSEHLKTGGFLAQTKSPTGKTDSASLVDLVWESDSLYVSGSYLDVGEDFDPTMGFFKRLGIREYHVSYFNAVRPEKVPVGPVLFLVDVSRVVRPDGELQSQNEWYEFAVHTKNWAGLYLLFYNNIEVLDQPFEIHPGVVIPPGRYEFSSPFIGWQGNPGKPFYPFARVHWGEFYDGDFSTMIFGLRTRAVRGLFTRLFIEHTDINLPAGDFVIDFVSLNVTYAASPTLSGKALVEWRKDDTLSANVGIRWEYRPGAAFYLIYKEFRDLFDLPDDDRPDRDRSLIVKTTFFF